MISVEEEYGEKALNIGDEIYIYLLRNGYSLLECFNLATQYNLFIKGRVINYRSEMITTDPYNIRNGMLLNIYEVLGDDGNIYYGTHDGLGHIHNIREITNCGLKTEEEITKQRNIQLRKVKNSRRNYERR